MSAVKERTAGGGTPTIQWQNQQSADSLLEMLWSVNDDSVNEEKADALKRFIGSTATTNEMRMYFIGKLYEMRKEEISQRARGRDANGLFLKNEKRPCGRDSKYRETADHVAEEIGIGATTVKKFGLVAKGIDAVRDMDEKTARKILSAEKKVRVDDLRAIGIAEPDIQKGLARSLVLGRSIDKRKVISKARHRKEDLGRIAECVSGLFGETVPTEYTFAQLKKDIMNNAEPFVALLEQMVSHNRELCRKNRDALASVIHENIIQKIEKIEEEI